MKQPKTIAFICMLYRALLHLAPKGFLDEYEALLLSDFRALCHKAYRQRGPWGVLALWPTTLVHTARDIGFERFDVIKLFFTRLFSMIIGKKLLPYILIIIIITTTSITAIVNNTNNINVIIIIVSMVINSGSIITGIYHLQERRMLRRKSVKPNNTTK